MLIKNHTKLGASWWKALRKGTSERERERGKSCLSGWQHSQGIWQPVLNLVESYRILVMMISPTIHHPRAETLLPCHALGKQFTRTTLIVVRVGNLSFSSARVFPSEYIFSVRAPKAMHHYLYDLRKRRQLAQQYQQRRPGAVAS